MQATQVVPAVVRTPQELVEQALEVLASETSTAALRQSEMSETHTPERNVSG